VTLYDRNGCPTPALANSDEYRDNWDRIFGKKEKKEEPQFKCLACNDKGVIKRQCEAGFYEDVPCRSCSDAAP
jgi:hypothetical protein